MGADECHYIRHFTTFGTKIWTLGFGSIWGLHLNLGSGIWDRSGTPNTESQEQEPQGPGPRHRHSLGELYGDARISYRGESDCAAAGGKFLAGFLSFVFCPL